MNKKVSEIDLPDSIFCIKVFPDLLHQYIRYQGAKNRQGSHKTKSRSEISGRAKKPFAQKGTGNARQGSSKAPHFRGGGIAFGPVVRDHSIKLNKKEKKLALKCAFSAKHKKNEIIILKDISLNKPKTKILNTKFKKFNFDSAIFIQNKDEINKNFILASSNIPKVDHILTEGLNVRDMLSHQKIFITKNAIQNIEKKLIWEVLNIKKLIFL